MGPFIASEALAAGRVSRYELAADHRRLLPDVDAPKRARLCLDDRIEAAWLWSRRGDRPRPGGIGAARRGLGRAADRH